jgi:hypothetical protein
MKQSKRHSLIESITNVIVGYAVSVVAQIFIFPIFNIETTLKTNLKIGLFFTIVSIIRSYILRRIFTKRTE